MGLITSFIALLNLIFRTIEYLSINLFHTGKFPNTDKKICRSCLVSGKRNWDLCTDDRLVWLLDLEYPEGLYVWINAVGGVSFVVLGMAGMWCNYLDGWWKFSEGFDSIIEFLLFHWPDTLFVSPSHTFIISTLIHLIFLLTFLTSLTSLFAITAPSILNPNPRGPNAQIRTARKRRASQRNCFWIFVPGIAHMTSLWGLLWTRKVGMGDFEIVVMPMITGGWLVVCAGLLRLEWWVKVRYGIGIEGNGGSVTVGCREDSEERGGRRKVDAEEKMYD